VGHKITFVGGGPKGGDREIIDRGVAKNRKKVPSFRKVCFGMLFLTEVKGKTGGSLATCEWRKILRPSRKKKLGPF